MNKLQDLARIAETLATLIRHTLARRGSRFQVTTDGPTIQVGSAHLRVLGPLTARVGWLGGEMPHLEAAAQVIAEATLEEYRALLHVEPQAFAELDVTPNVSVEDLEKAIVAHERLAVAVTSAEALGDMRAADEHRLALRANRSTILLGATFLSEARAS